MALENAAHDQGYEPSERSQSTAARRSTPRACVGSVSRPIVWPDEDSLLDSGWAQGTFIIAVGLLPLVLVLVMTQPSRRARDASVAQSAEAPPPGTKTDTSPKRAGRNSAPGVKPSGTNKPAQAKWSPAMAYRRARERLAKGDYEGAIREFDDVLRQKPEFIWCYYYRAGACSLMGNQSAAMKDLDRLAVAMPTEARVWRARAVVDHRTHNLIAAVADISRAVELVEKSADRGDAELAKLVRVKAAKLADELFEHSTARLRAGDCATAIEGFSELLRHKPDFASAWLRRAIAYDTDGQFDKALADVNEALRLRPGPAQAFAMRSVLHERRQDYVAALDDMSAARRLGLRRTDYAERVRWLQRQQGAQRSQQLVARWRIR